MTATEILEGNGYEEVVIFSNPSYDSAIIGVDSNNKAIYDYDKMIDYLMTEDGMTEEDAADFISYNTIRALSYVENAPIVMYPLH